MGGFRDQVANDEPWNATEGYQLLKSVAYTIDGGEGYLVTGRRIGNGDRTDWRLQMGKTRPSRMGGWMDL
jgi:hypothetical protein